MTEDSSTRLYLEIKDTIDRHITEENQHSTIPACPDWTLRDMLGHLVGSIEDFSNGNTEGLGSDPWTAAQVQRYAHLDLDGVKHAWSKVIESMGDQFAACADADMPDIAVHEFDVLGAVNEKGNREKESLRVIVPFFVEILSGVFESKGLPTLRVDMGSDAVTIGKGEPLGVLKESHYELSRAVTGRRSLAQLRALDWSVDSAPWVEHISLFPPRPSDLVE